jgi:hypothetical protein
VSARSDQLKITPGQAVYVLTRLVDDGKVSAREVERIAAQMSEEIAELKSRLARLQGALDTPGAQGKPRRRGAVSIQQSSSRKIQGEYMGLIRHLTAKDRGRIKKIAAENGREAAIREMRSMPQ